jgi:hypothetical protein
MLTTPLVPAAVILHDVARLAARQYEALSAYVAGGGGVLVCLGARAELGWYNETLYRDGQGWLPATLDSLAGDEARPKAGAQPDPATFTHPALAIFSKLAAGGLGDARFPRWWRLTAVGRPGGLMESPDGKVPFLVEKVAGAGRVLLSPVPMDASWGSNLPDLAAFVPLAHELVYHLAGARSGEYNLAPGRPIRFPVTGDASGYTLALPGGQARPLSTEPGVAGTWYARQVQGPGGATLVYDGVRESGVYTVRGPEGTPTYFVVPADAREGDLTPMTDDARRVVSKLTGMRFTSGEDEAAFAGAEEGAGRQDLWPWLLMVFVAILCVEVWMTRRLAMKR